MSAPTIKLDTAEELARWLWHQHGVTPRQIHQWARRRKITRYPGGLYSGIEVVKFIEEGRDTRMHAVRSFGKCAGQRRDTI